MKSVILYNAFRNDSYKSLLKYRKMEKTNNNGKKRCIDSPNLTTRIYQYVYLNKIEPVYFSKDNLMGLNCKKGCGITSSIDYKSVLHRRKKSLRISCYTTLQIPFCRQYKLAEDL